MSDLETKLMEIEPIFRSTDDTFQFTHPSFQEVLTAKQFADEINFGRLSVRDAYVNFWSYEEDTRIWRLRNSDNCRALLPDWFPILLDLAPNLDYDKLEKLFGVGTESYLNAKNPDPNYYNPFEEDYRFMLILASRNPKLQKKLSVSRVEKLKSYDKKEKLESLQELVFLGYYTKETIGLLDYEDEEIKIFALQALARLDHFDEKIIEFLKDNNPRVRWYAIHSLRLLNHFDEKLFEVAAFDEDKKVKSCAKYFIRSHLEGTIIKSSSSYTRLITSDKQSWGQISFEDLPLSSEVDQDLIKKMDSWDNGIRIDAIYSMGYKGMYHPRLLGLLDEQHFGVRNATANVLARLAMQSKEVFREINCLEYNKYYEVIFSILNSISGYGMASHPYSTVINKRNINPRDSSSYLKEIHLTAKPKGYNPPIKRLVA